MTVALRSLFFALAVVCAAPARADDVNSAEHDRIADEMSKLAQRQIWPGVERKYQELLKLGTALNLQDHIHGAMAAREAGDVLAAYDRLKEAVKIKATREVVDWLWDIDNNYGLVELVSVPARSAALDAGELPFDPNHRRAVEAAIEVARKDGVFIGMLPRGEYTFAGQKFSVTPGLAVRIEVSPRMRRQGIIDPVIRYTESPGAIRVGGAPSSPSPAGPPPSPEESP
jgi:hypothetical protein